MWIPACKAPTQFPDVGIPILHWYRSSNIQTHLHRENPRQSEIPDKHQKRREFQPDHGRKEKMMENTCKTCINNDDGLCDHRGILVEDEDSCEHHLAAGKKVRMNDMRRRWTSHQSWCCQHITRWYRDVKASRPVKMEPAATASCINTVQVHQIFFRKTGRRYIIHIWQETRFTT